MTEHYYKNLPRKRMGAGALFLNQHHQILIVKPTYRPDWLLPGGIIESDESPAQGCLRKAQEELGLTVSLQQLLCIDYTTPQDIRTEALQFVFYCGILAPSHIDTITLQETELNEYRFTTPELATQLLDTRAASPSACKPSTSKKLFIWKTNNPSCLSEI